MNTLRNLILLVFTLTVAAPEIFPAKRPAAGDENQVSKKLRTNAGEEKDEKDNKELDEQVSIDCLICLNTIEADEAAIQNTCTHQFHRECFVELLCNSLNPTCPLCRHKIQQASLEFTIEESACIAAQRAALTCEIKANTDEHAAAEQAEIVHEQEFEKAIIDNNFEEVCGLLQDGVSPNSVDDDNTPVLLLAAERGFTNIVQELLAKGAYPDSTDNEGNTALILASKNGFIETMNVLIGAQCDVNAVNRRAQSPLMLSAESEQTDAVRVLLRAQADPCLEDFDEVIAQNYTENDEITDLISSQVSVNAQFLEVLYQNINPNDALTAVTQCVQNGAHVNVCDLTGNSLLHRAAIYGLTHVVAFLLDSGAIIDHENNVGYTPLLNATSAGHLETMHLLSGRGANVNAQQMGQPILHQIISSNRIESEKTELIKTLLASGRLTLNTRDQALKTTAVLLATYKQNLNVLALLLEHGADPSIPNKSGMTPLHIAVQFKSKKCAKILVKHLQRSGDLAALESKTQDGDTPLHHAAQANNAPLIKYLLSLGANKESINSNGETPLDQATESNHKKAMKALR